MSKGSKQRPIKDRINLLLIKTTMKYLDKKNKKNLKHLINNR